MYPSDESLDPRFKEKLAVFGSVPSRDPQAAARGRADFLLQAQAMAEAAKLSEAVSETQTGRHKGWIQNLPNLFQRKEGSPMFASLVSILVVVSLFLGGTGATVFAAQGSLPNQPLYGVKILSEDLRLDLAGDPQDQLELNLAFAERRMEEFNATFQRGAPLSEAVLARYRQQLDQALKLACGLDDPQLARVLERIRLNLHSQEQALEHLQGLAGPQAEAGLARAQDMIRTRLRRVEDGLRNPQGFRKQAGGQQPGQEIPGGPSASQVPAGGAGSSYGPGPFVTGTPTPGSGYGPGPGPDASVTPGSGERYGPGPNPSHTPCSGEGSCESNGPGPGSGTVTEGGDGPGPGADDGETPGSGAGSGPGPGPAADSSCTAGSCEGAGPSQDAGHHDGGHGGGEGSGHNRP